MQKYFAILRNLFKINFISFDCVVHGFAFPVKVPQYFLLKYPWQEFYLSIQFFLLHGTFRFPRQLSMANNFNGSWSSSRRVRMAYLDREPRHVLEIAIHPFRSRSSSDAVNNDLVSSFSFSVNGNVSCISSYKGDIILRNTISMMIK